MSTDFKEKRIEYLNNWPNVEPFDIEKQYYSLVDRIKKESGTIFVPFRLKKNNDTSYNKTISFTSRESKRFSISGSEQSGPFFHFKSEKLTRNLIDYSLFVGYNING